MQSSSTVNSHKLFYQIDLTVTGSQLLNVQQTDFTVSFSGISSGVDYEGKPLVEWTSFQPYLERPPDNHLLALFNTPRFEKKNPVRLILTSKQETIADIALSEYLEQNDTGIDFHNDKDVIIPIDVDITTAGITITVNDWDEGAIQIPIVGI